MSEAEEAINTEEAAAPETEVVFSGNLSEVERSLLTRDLAVMVTAIFDNISATQQLSDESIAAFNRVAHAIGYRPVNNLFFDQVQPE